MIGCTYGTRRNEVANIKRTYVRKSPAISRSCSVASMLCRASDWCGRKIRWESERVEETRRLGASGLSVSALGAGTWSWGDGPFWGYGAAPDRDALTASFRASVEGGVTFFDTAEFYGGGGAERVLGALRGRPVALSSLPASSRPIHIDSRRARSIRRSTARSPASVSRRSISISSIGRIRCSRPTR